MDELYTEGWLKKVKPHTHLKLFAEGDVIQIQGERLKKINFILSGEIEAVSNTSNGQQIWIGQFSQGDFIGQEIISQITDSHCELIAKTPVRLLDIPIAIAMELIGGENSFTLALAQSLATRIDHLIERVVQSYSLSVKGQICAELLKLSVPMGRHPGKAIIRPNPVFVDIARRVNSTRETVSRTVSELQKMGIVRREPGALVIENTALIEVVFSQ